MAVFDLSKCVIRQTMRQKPQYPSQEYHQQQDEIFNKYSGVMGFGFYVVNEFIEMMAHAVPDETGTSYRYPTPREFVELLVPLHNRCVENIQKGQSVARYEAILWETRVRMKGAIAADSLLLDVPGIQMNP